MVIDKEIKMKVNGKMVKKYNELGFKVKQYDEIMLPVKYLSKYSHQKVLCACDKCEEQKLVKYNNYCKYIKKDPENLYTCKKCNLEKRKNTCMKRYGVEFVAKLESSKEKAKETMKKNGTMMFFCNPEYKNKMMELYGVDNASKDPKIHKKQHSGFILKHHKGLYYRGTYEKHFIEYCLEHNIEVENFNGNIQYDFNGSVHKYFPDFYLKKYNLIVEIKSCWTYDCEKEQNECKRIGSLKTGHNFLFIIDKKYDIFNSYINKKEIF